MHSEKLDAVGMGSKHSSVTHAENTDWEAFPCTDQSVLQIAVSPQITEGLCVFVLVPGVNLLQFCTKDKFKRGND